MKHKKHEKHTYFLCHDCTWCGTIQDIEEEKRCPECKSLNIIEDCLLCDKEESTIPDKTVKFPEMDFLF